MKFIVVAAFAAGLLGTLPAAFAQSREDQQSACMSDAFRLCSAQIPDEPAIEKCLGAQLPSLSPACRAQFDDPAPTPARPKSRR